jgi:uncharacterized membrane protein YcaP (DUF421 family)
VHTVIRIAIIYVVVMIGLRIIGKRELSQLAPRELVMLLLIPELFSQAALGEDFSMTNAIIAFVTLLVLVFWTSVLTYLSPRAGRLVDATPAVLVRHGELVPGALHRERITAEEVFSEMRHVGLTQLSQVDWAILEGDGKISIVPARESERYQRREESSTPL